MFFMIGVDFVKICECIIFLVLCLLYDVNFD